MVNPALRIYSDVWDAAITYRTGDWVLRNNYLYAAIQDSLNEDPDTETAYWAKTGDTIKDNDISRYNGIRDTGVNEVIDKFNDLVRKLNDNGILSYGA